MARQYGYTVTIKGFLPADRKSLQDVHKATALILLARKDAKARAELANALTGVAIDVRNTSVELPDGQPQPQGTTDESF